MKTNHGLNSYLSLFGRFTLSFAVISSSNLALASEVTTTNKPPAAPAAKKEDLPTAEEKAMGAVKSPYKACEGVVTVEQSPRPTGSQRGGVRTKAQREWDEKAEFWKNYPGKGCDVTKVNCTRKVQYIPSTAFYKSFDGRAKRPDFSSNESADDFLSRVAAKSQQKVEARIKELKALKACADAPTPTCKTDLDARVATLKTKIPQFRAAVARLNEQSARLLYVGSGIVSKQSGKTLIPRDFENIQNRLIAPTNMPKLTDKEYAPLAAEMDALVQQAYKDREAEIEEQIKSRNITQEWEKREYRAANFGAGKSTAWIAPKFEEAKAKNVEQYNKLLAANPLLGYLNESDLAPAAMSKKLAVAIKDAEETLSDLQDAAKAASGAPGGVNPKKMGFAAHTETIEEILASEGDGRSCAAANATLNELATVRTKEGAITGGITAASSLFLWGAGSLVGRGVGSGVVAMMGSSSAAMGNTLGALAFAAGVAGGFTDTAMQLNVANETIRDGRLGLVKPEDVDEAFKNKSLTTALGFLNLQGGSVYLGAAAGTGLAVAGATTKLLLSKVLKDGAKGGGGPASKNAETLAANLIKADKGDKAAQQAVLAVAAAETKKVVGRTLSAQDQAALDAVTATGIAGTNADPNPETLQVVADKLAGLQGSERVAAVDAYVAQVKEIAASVNAKPIGDAGRQAAAREAGVEAAGEIPAAQVAAILNDPTWTELAIRGWKAVIAKMREFKGTQKERFLAAHEALRVKAGLVKKPDSEVLQSGVCARILPASAVTNNGESLDTNGEPVYMVCAR